MRITYSPPTVDYKKKRASQTIPDQSLSIQEIVKRYVRGIPVDVLQREPVYVDQSDHDLEKLARMDFHEKAEYANALAQDAAEMKGTLDRRHAQTIAKAEAEKSQKSPADGQKQKEGQPLDKQDGVK